jgi:dienelactone hydrolase
MLLSIVLSALALWQPRAQGAAARAELVVTQLTAGQFEAVEVQFTDQMKAALPAGKLADSWKSLSGQVGAFQKQTGTREEQTGAFHIGVVSCVFERAALDVRVVYDADWKIAGLNMRPAAAPAVPYARPPYADPASFAESDATVGSGEWKLPGTLTLPKGDGPYPALVLIHGSGPNDRDETIGPQKPFADLAAGLASRGIAVLRFDKRTMVHGMKMTGDITVKEEVIDDAVAAVAAARANSRIDPARVFVLGHSLGGMLIPRIAAADSSVAGFIVMAGAARPLEQAMLEQIEYLARADGTVSPDEQKAIDEARRSADEVHALTPADARSHKLIDHAPASYWLDLRGYDPPSAAKAITKPLLVLQGERDYQVTMAEFARWKAALETKPNVTFKSYPALNHLMIAGTGKSLPEEYSTPGHVAQDVVDEIATWIKTRKG